MKRRKRGKENMTQNETHHNSCGCRRRHRYLQGAQCTLHSTLHTLQSHIRTQIYFDSDKGNDDDDDDDDHKKKNFQFQHPTNVNELFECVMCMCTVPVSPLHVRFAQRRKSAIVCDTHSRCILIDICCSFSHSQMQRRQQQPATIRRTAVRRRRIVSAQNRLYIVLYSF